MPPAGPAAAHDWATIAAVYSSIVTVASLSIAFPYYAIHLPPLWQVLGPVSNGLAGGVIAGSVAIAVYRISKRSKSREKKFVPARALVAELNQVHDAVQPADDRLMPTPQRYDAMSRAPDAARLTKGSMGVVGQGQQRMSKSGTRAHPLPDVPRQAYDGLVSSGGIFHIEPTLQLRLHEFYKRVECGDYEEVGRQIRPLVLEVARFRDINAPFTWADLALPVRRVATRLCRRRREQRKTQFRTGQTPEAMTGAPFGSR